MFASFVRCLVLIALGWVVTLSAHADGVAPEARVIVKLRSGSSLLAGRSVVMNASASTVPMQRLGQRMGLNLVDGRTLNARTHVATAQGLRSEELAARLSTQSDVEYAVVDQWRKVASVVTPNDPLFTANSRVAAGQWYLGAPTATLVSAINAPTAWGITQGSSAVTVAVVDTGVRFDHPDLNAKLSTGYNMITSSLRAGNGSTNSGGRSTDASDLGDWLTQSEINANASVYSGCSVETSSSWHGTQVSGIIGASSNNSVGMASLAWNSPVLPVRALGKCGGYDSDILAGMLWAAGLYTPSSPDPVATPSQTAKVINLSLGGAGTCTQAYQDVVTELTNHNVVVVAAAGNSNGEAVSVPANCPGVIAVAGVRQAGTKVGYSSLGPEVSISAPAGNCVNASGACTYPILTTLNTGSTTPVTDANGGSTYSGDGTNTAASLGTSFAAPQVSGTVALMLSVRSDLTPAAVRQLLKNSARAFPTSGGTSGISQCQAPSSSEQAECYCTTTTCGRGMLDAGAAVTAANTAQAVAAITISPVAPTPNSTVTLTAAGSVGSTSSATISGYAWSVQNASGTAVSVSSSTSSTATFTPAASGTYTVTLTVTDSLGNTSSSSQALAVAGTGTTSSSMSSTTDTSTSSGGGGGGVDGWDLLGLLGFGLLAWSLRRQRAAGRS